MQLKWKLMSIVLSIVPVVAELLGMAAISQAEPGTWTKRADIPIPRWAHASSVVKDKIYTIGGTTITRGAWETVPFRHGSL